ncbi:MAG: hypothetical protein Q9165_001633 [Trypethelium subeluteriae]
MTNSPFRLQSQGSFSLSPIQDNCTESPGSEPSQHASQDVTMMDVDSISSHQDVEERRECGVRPDEGVSEEEDENYEVGGYSSDEDDEDTKTEDEDNDVDMMDVDFEPVRINFQPSADLSEADSRLEAILSSMQHGRMTDEDIDRILMDAGMQGVGDMYYLMSGRAPTFDNDDDDDDDDEEEEDKDNDAGEPVRGLEPPYTQSNDLTEANQMFDRFAVALLNGEMTEEGLVQAINRLEPQRVLDMMHGAENRFSVLQGRHDDAAQREVAETLTPGRYLRTAREYQFLRRLEQQATHRSQTIFAGHVDENIQYTAQSLGDSFPGLAWAISRWFPRTAVRIPLRLDGLDLVAERFTREAVLFSWHQAIEQMIEQTGQRFIETMLFQHRPSDPRNRPVTPNGVYHDTILPDHRRRPLFDGESKNLPSLRRIETDNVSWGRIQAQQMIFQELYNTDLRPSARTLEESLPGIDVAIRTVFGLFQTTRPINVEYLDYLAEHGIVRRGVLASKAADSEAWVDALEYAIGDTSKQEVDDELFTDWEDPLPPEVSPTEQQLLHFILSRDRDLSDRFRAVFKSMYAAHREHEDRREVQEASEQLQTIVRRQIESIGPLPPPIYFPQTLGFYEEADEARRGAVEEDVAIERQRRPRPASTEDHDCRDDYTEAAALREDEHAWDLRLEELCNQRPQMRFINAWFLFMTQRLAEDDTEEGRWGQWGGIQRRLQRLNTDAQYRIAFRNMTEGITVVDLLCAEERQQQRQTGNIQRQTLLAHGTMSPEDFDDRNFVTLIDYLRAEYARVTERCWQDYVEALQEAPQEVRDRVAESEHGWNYARIGTWNDGLGCDETPAQELVEADHERENRERATRGEPPLRYLGYELEIARLHDVWSHQHGHAMDLDPELTGGRGTLELDGRQFAITLPRSR